MLLGWEAPNRVPFTEDEVYRMSQGKVLKVRPYHLPYLPRTGWTPSNLILRPNEDSIPDPQELIACYQALLPYGRVRVEIDNEPNHPDRHLDPGYWYSSIVPLVRELKAAGIPTISPGLAVNYDEASWEPWIAALSCSQHGLHLYWDRDKEFEAYMARIVPGAVVTELGDSSNDGWEVKLLRYQEAIRRLVVAGCTDGCIFIAGDGYGEWKRYVPPVGLTAALMAPAGPQQEEGTVTTQADIDNALNTIWGVSRLLKGEQALAGDTLPNLGQQLQDAVNTLKEVASPNS